MPQPHVRVLWLFLRPKRAHGMFPAPKPSPLRPLHMGAPGGPDFSPTDSYPLLGTVAAPQTPAQSLRLWRPRGSVTESGRTVRSPCAALHPQKGHRNWAFLFCFWSSFSPAWLLFLR